MGEFNQVLWTLDREIAPQDFERLCVDLLCRDGYWKIVPVGAVQDFRRPRRRIARLQATFNPSNQGNLNLTFFWL